MSKIETAEEVLSLVRKGKKAKGVVSGIQETVGEMEGHPKDALRVAVKEAIKHPIKTGVLLSGGLGDPAALAAGADLAADVKKSLDKELGRNAEAAKKAADAADAAKKAANAAEDASRIGNMANSGGLMGGLAAGGGGGGGKSVGGAGFKGDSESWMKMLFVWAILVQAFDAFYLQFNRAYLPLAIIGYFSIALGAFIFLKDHRGGRLLSFAEIGIAEKLKRLIFFFSMAFFYVLIPGYMWIFPQGSFIGGPSIASWASFFLAIIPFWPIYIGMHIDDPEIKKWVHRYVNFWIFFLIFLALFYFSFQLRTGNLGALGARPETLEFASVGQFLVEKTADTFKNMWKGLDPTVTIERLINASGLNYYTGTVDENEKAPVGLYMDNLRTADPYFFEGDPIIIYADLRGKSFNEPIRVHPHCYIDTKSKSEDGDADPIVFEFLGEEHDTLQCTFLGLEPGSYRSRVTAAFNFETWAYVTYTFVDLELKRAMELQGKNVNHELDVPRYPEAVYTNGPAMIGMGAQVDQPVGVDVDNNNRDAIIGITLDNVWTEGRIEGVHKFVLQVPSDFELLNCDRWYPEKTKEPKEKDKEGYDFYEFSKEEIGDVRSRFSSVTCRVHIKNPKEFLAGQQKVQRTFVVQATYDYTLEKTISVRVRE
ncbi:hypothetical protein JW826_05565 [Candidatus Woesearchaeota archaeon]|nr:hypothetical protein [Candidatus Woesearchaeota archaeon]